MLSSPKHGRIFNAMIIETTPLEGILIIHPQVFEDSRGFFYESYNEKKFAEHGLPTVWAQDNHSLSVKGTLRGLHFQRGKGQAKLVRCLRGSIWDVAVDIRPDSPTFTQWFGMELSDANHTMMLVAEGFAHGFVVLSDVAEIAYKCSSVYDAEIEDEIRWDEPQFGVQWPVANPILSKRDMTSGSLDAYLERIGHKKTDA
jgi:dTDP-4-dehydrorhamnose 3,5-epimerase